MPFDELQRKIINQTYINYVQYSKCQGTSMYEIYITFYA
jgi:hypothetical protein